MSERIVRGGRGMSLFSLALLVGCATSSKRQWLRYELAGQTDWQQVSASLYSGSLNGAGVTVDLLPSETRVLVTVDNSVGEPLRVRIGPGEGAPRAPIGEFLLRPLDPSLEPGPDTQVLTAQRAVNLEPGWRGRFYIDRPLGRDPKLGQLVVLEVEIENAAGGRESRRMPLQVKRSDLPKGGGAR